VKILCTQQCKTEPVDSALFNTIKAQSTLSTQTRKSQDCLLPSGPSACPAPSASPVPLFLTCLLTVPPLHPHWQRYTTGYLGKAFAHQSNSNVRQKMF